MKKLAYVAAGGTLGSFTRYLFTESISRYLIAIFAVNILGVAVAGIIAYRVKPSATSEIFWISGFAGGFTTFSSVALIYSQSETWRGFIYFFAMVLVSLAVLRFISPKVES